MVQTIIIKYFESACIERNATEFTHAEDARQHDNHQGHGNPRRHRWLNSLCMNVNVALKVSSHLQRLKKNFVILSNVSKEKH